MIITDEIHRVIISFITRQAFLTGNCRGKTLSNNYADKIVIAPQLDEASHFDLYAVAIGSDDSFHAGNNVNLNPPGALGCQVW